MVSDSPLLAFVSAVASLGEVGGTGVQLSLGFSAPGQQEGAGAVPCSLGSEVTLFLRRACPGRRAAEGSRDPLAEPILGRVQVVLAVGLLPPGQPLSWVPRGSCGV